MFRKKRQPAPFFRLPGAPFNPATGENALLGQYLSKGTTLALFQVIGDDPTDISTQDTHDNYVVCRGYEADFDPNFRFLHDPYTVPTTTPINVAKPYSVRGTFPYELGQVIVAARIKGRLGFNPGAGASIGQPANLDEEIGLLTDDDGVGIAWLDIAPPQTAIKSSLLAGYGSFGTIGAGVNYYNWAVGNDVSVSGNWSWNGSTEFTWNGATQQWLFVAITVRAVASIHITSTTTFNIEIQKSPYGALAGGHLIMAYPPQNITDGWLDTRTWTGHLRFDPGDKIKLAAGRMSGDTAVTLSSDQASLSIFELDAVSQP